MSSVYNKVIDNTKGVQSLSSEKQTLPFDIEFARVSKSIGDIKLSDVNIVFKEGSKYAIIGKNGSGKSTLLDMIMRRKDTDSGEILFSGRAYDEKIAKNNIFYIRQKNHYFSNTLMENISVLGSYKVKDVEFIRKENLEKMFSCGNNANNLSGGEKQIMSMYQAINSNKSVILLDEPFSALTEELEFFYTRSLLKLNGTVVLVTHNNDKKYLELFDEVINVDYFLAK
ncbi:MAG: ATP-binding cassette domain-containing protein [Tissierellia bacterium]|nr:ATP-binding cassette domain-containing protein [Tissierellia bacterium]